MECFKIIVSSPYIKILNTHQSFILQEPFTYKDINNKTLKFSKMEYTPDIIVEIETKELPIAIEIKGFERSDYKMRKKMFIYKYKDQYTHLQINNIKEAKEFIREVEK